ncbi:blue copper protein-like [Senna tora]|uniref:Blue copper protein-like n=1 Tax=Senna tora TaxID=362788 RepID=A0A834TWP2_9FABA|nr:blue copper protein-like [Senna tora]
MAFSNAFFILGVVTVAINMALPAMAAVYTVGDSSGWAIGVDYGTWASSLTFRVGDTIVFNYGAGHTVDEVKESDYKSCTTGNSLSTDSSGATSIPLKTAGTHYFICAIPGHCGGGMKLSVNVKAGKASAPSASPTPSSAKGSPSDDTPATTTATPSTTRSNTSSGSRVSPIVGVLVVSWICQFVVRLV